MIGGEVERAVADRLAVGRTARQETLRAAGEGDHRFERGPVRFLQRLFPGRVRRPDTRGAGGGERGVYSAQLDSENQGRFDDQAHQERVDWDHHHEGERVGRALFVASEATDGDPAAGLARRLS